MTEDSPFERLRGVERLALPSDGEPVPVQDVELPLCFAATRPLELSVEQGVGVFKAHPSISYTWTWNPFAEREDIEQAIQKPKQANRLAGRWKSRISYGLATLELQIDDGTRPRIVLDVQPGHLTCSQLDRMKRDIASIAPILLRAQAGGRTQSQAALLPDEPVDGRELLARLDEVVGSCLPALRQIAARPVVGFNTGLRRRVGLRSADGPSLDVYENRVVHSIVTVWQRQLTLVARVAAAHIRESERNERETPLGPGSRLSPADLNAIRADQGRVMACIRRARTLRSLLQQALGPLEELQPVPPPFRRTPRMHADARYRRLLNAWGQVKALDPTLDLQPLSLLPDTLASMVYERWALIAFFASLLEDGWQADNQLLDIRRSPLCYTLSLSGRSWIFSRGDERLTLHYEPNLRLRSARGTGAEKRDNALAKLAGAEELPPAGLITCAHQRTPDLIVHLKLDDGRQAMATGDMIFAPVLDDGSITSEESAVAVLGKDDKVLKDYANKVFHVDDDGRVTLSDPRCGFVAYPGSASSADRLLQAGMELMPLPLMPTDNKRDLRPHTAYVQELLERLRYYATEPRDLSSYA